VGPPFVFHTPRASRPPAPAGDFWGEQRKSLAHKCRQPGRKNANILVVSIASLWRLGPASAAGVPEPFVISACFRGCLFILCRPSRFEGVRASSIHPGRVRPEGPLSARKSGGGGSAIEGRNGSKEASRNDAWPARRAFRHCPKVSTWPTKTPDWALPRKRGNRSEFPRGRVARKRNRA